MKYVSTNRVRSGTFLGKPLYDCAGSVLFEEFTKLTPAVMRTIRQNGYKGLYVVEFRPEGEVISRDVVNDIRIKATSNLDDIFDSIITNDVVSFDSAISNTKEAALILVTSLLEDNRALFNVSELKTHNQYTYNHSYNVSVLSVATGLAMGLAQEDLCKLYMAAMLHDIGKRFIPNEILDKPSKLTDSEYLIAKTHTTSGYYCLKNVYDVPLLTRVGILQHHENYDGSGYPYGLSANEISLFGSIIHVTDVFDAFASKRCYHEERSLEDTLAFVKQQAGKMFCPKVVAAFEQCTI